MTRTQTMEAFRVGDRVLVSLGAQRLEGLVVEDRGGLGVGGRKLFVVRMPMEPAEPLVIEVSETQVEPYKKPPKLDKARIVKYLERGGLLAILRTNVSGGGDQPRIWLRYDSCGNVTHTLEGDFGVVGGDAVPYWTTSDERILKQKVDAVRKFLRSFGLADSEAMGIISSVGTKS